MIFALISFVDLNLKAVNVFLVLIFMNIKWHGITEYVFRHQGYEQFIDDTILNMK